MSHRSASLHAVALVALVAVVGLGPLALLACSSTGGDEASGVGAAPTSRPVVVIVGDSITERGQDVLRAQLGAGRDLSIDGKSGFTISQQLPAAATLAQIRPTQAIVNLGTNDVWTGRSVRQISADLEQVVDQFPMADCIHLVTIAEGMGTSETGVDWSAVATEANAAMADLADRHVTVDVIDWADRLRDHDDDGQPDGALLADTVHPTALGQQALADLYEDALESCGG